MLVSRIDALSDVLSRNEAVRIKLWAASFRPTLLRLYEAVISDVLMSSFLLVASLLRILSMALT
jgi:hypothetical protein